MTAQLGDRGVMELVPALSPMLRQLYMPNTSCGDAGAQAVASALTSSAIEELSMAFCQLGAVGFAALADAALPR